MDNANQKDDLSNTLRFMRCTRCGNVFVTSIGGHVECSECSSLDAIKFNPEQDGSAE